MKLWIDDVRPAPEGYVWAKTVNDAKDYIVTRETLKGLRWYFSNDTSEVIQPFELIDIDHDAGNYVNLGGDYIKLLDWLEETGRSYPIRIHSMNPVGVENMRRIIRRNGWTEVR